MNAIVKYRDLTFEMRLPKDFDDHVASLDVLGLAGDPPEQFLRDEIESMYTELKSGEVPPDQRAVWESRVKLHMATYLRWLQEHGHRVDGSISMVTVKIHTGL